MHPLVNCGPVTSGPTTRAAPGRASAHRERGAVHAPGTGVSPSHGWVTARAGHRPGDATARCRMRDTAPALNTARSAPRIRPRHPFPWSSATPNTTAGDGLSSVTAEALSLVDVRDR